MGKCFLHGNGGENPLGFKVISFVNEEALNAAQPKGNVIGVAPVKEMTGYTFSAKEPTSPTEGLVWFLVNTSSVVSFSATKKNPVMVYPTSAKQYADGAWRKVSAKSFQNGTAVEWWNGVLFEPGNQHEDITGGWKCVSNYGMTGSVTDAGIVFSVIGDSGRDSSAYTNNKINTADYSTLKVDADFSGGEGILVGLIDRNDLDDPESYCIASVIKSKDDDNPISLDISQYNGSYYVVVYSHASAGTVRKVYLT